MVEQYKETENTQDLNIPFIKPELTIEECRKVLSGDGEEYTDQELIEIRTLILNLVEIDYKMYQRRKAQEKTEARIINLTSEEETNRKAA